jgi:hypothetical protein
MFYLDQLFHPFSYLRQFREQFHICRLMFKPVDGQNPLRIYPTFVILCITTRLRTYRSRLQSNSSRPSSHHQPRSITKPLHSNWRYLLGRLHKILHLPSTTTPRSNQHPHRQCRHHRRIQLLPNLENPPRAMGEDIQHQHPWDLLNNQALPAQRRRSPKFIGARNRKSSYRCHGFRDWQIWSSWTY